jgi:hypothetical protein
MSERQLHQMTAMARFLARLPAAEALPVNLALAALQESVQLAEMYVQTGQLDFARGMYKKALGYARVLPPAELWRVNLPTAGKPFVEADGPKFKEQFLTQLERPADQLERQVDIQGERVMQQARTPTAKFVQAIEKALPALALKVFRDTTDLADFGAERDEVVIQAIILEFKSGQLEQAVTHLKQLEDDIKTLSAREPRGERTVRFRALQELRYRLEGNTQAVIESLNQVTLGSLDPTSLQLVTEPTLPPVAARASANARAFAGLLFTAGGTVGTLNAWLATRQVLLNEMVYHYDRALLDLLDGNPARARRRFEMAAKPQGVDLAKLDEPQAALIQRYLDLLRSADAKR